MRNKYIKDYIKGEEISDFFLITSPIEIKEAKNGKPFASFKVRDKTKEIKCKCWSDTLNKLENNLIESLKSGDIIKIKGNVDEYNDNLQMMINKIAREINMTQEKKNIIRTYNCCSSRRIKTRSNKKTFFYGSLFITYIRCYGCKCRKIRNYTRRYKSR